MADDLFHHLDRLARPLAEAVLRAIAGAPTGSRWAAGWEFFRRATGTADRRDFAGAVAQGVVGLHYGVMADEAGALSPAGVDWLVRQADPAVRCVLDLGPWPWAGLAAGAAVADARAAVRDFLDPTRIKRLEQACRRPGSDDPTIYFLEQLLRRCDAGTRRRQGVFYTPQELVSFTVRGVDDCLKDEFQLPGGLADSTGDGEPFVRILDPAMGTGVFLAEVVRRIHRHVSRETDQAGIGAEPSPPPVGWEDYVTRRLLPRLVGQEVMLPALVLAHLSLARTLADTGYAFHEPGRLRLYLANTLRQPALEPGSPQSNATGGDERFSVVIGNPPFSGVSDNREPWLNALLRVARPTAGRSRTISRSTVSRCGSGNIGCRTTTSSLCGSPSGGSSRPGRESSRW